MAEPFKLRTTSDETADVPQFNYSEERLKQIQESLGIEIPEENAGTLPPTEQPKRPVKKRHVGRPSNKEREAERREALGLPPPEPEPTLPPAKLTKRDEREVSERLANMLMAGTGIASQAKSYLAMTEEEAKAIADPLASYLVRNADTIVVAQQVLENYDLLAIILGVLAYTVRIYRDRTNEVAELRQLRPVPNTTTLDRIQQYTDTNNNGAGQEQVSTNILGGPYGTGEWDAS